ncbi:MAG: M20/M25/M40 family metallo-hydrolase [Bacteroidales bacterium]|nr:M20/M25/M40 family metallo-hydrolase [Bacteroidales bacterium]
MDYVPHRKAYIDRLTAEATVLLKGMVAIPSPSFEEDAVCSHICDWMRERGISYKRIGNNILCGPEQVVRSVGDESRDGGERRKCLMLCAHIDTVSPSEDYGFNPYSPDYQEAAKIIGQISGRAMGEEDFVAGIGSNDDGGSVVAMLAAYRYFMENPEECATDLLLVLSCEEERSGKGGMTGLWEDLKGKVDYAIIGEPTGMRAATSERGLLVIDAVAEGISGHAARNEGVNALYIALEDIEAIRRHKFSRTSARMGEVNVNVTQINAGTAHNVIPDRCTFVIDIRPTEKYSNEEILNELQGICRSRLTPRNLKNSSSATFEESPLQKTLESLEIDTFSSPTTSDWMRVSCDTIKMGPGESSRSHKKDEFILKDEIENGIQTYISFIENFGK